MFLLPYSELETCYQLDAWETVRKLYILPLFSNTPAKLIFIYKTTLAMYFVCNVRKHHTFRRNTEEKTYRREVQSRRRDYFTSLRILIKQSNSWESSLIHLDSRQAECEWGSSNHLESWMDTKDKGLWNQENARRGYRIYNIMACFHKVCVIYLWGSRGTDISLSMEPRDLWEPWFSWASTALICSAREQICSLH